MAYTEIVLEITGHVAKLTLNQPDKANALSQAMIAEMDQALGEIAASEARVVILTGAGKHFCAGHKMDEMVGRDQAMYREIFANCTAMMRRLRALPQPVIGAVRGVATAAGCQLAATCDLLVAARNARFATPGVRIGLFCGTPAVALVRIIGRRRALDMLLTGRLVPAVEAMEWGMVNRLVEPGELMAEAEKLADHLAGASPLTMAMGKQTFYEQVERAEGDAYNLATPVMSLNLGMHDAQEGISAFLGKTRPQVGRALELLASSTKVGRRRLAI